MSNKERITLGLIVSVSTICIVLAAVNAFAPYHYVEGRIIGHAYTAGDVSQGMGVSNGQPVNPINATQEKYTLIIDVNGAVSSYDVSPETYAKAVQGQSVIRMKCNRTLCAVDAE